LTIKLLIVIIFIQEMTLYYTDPIYQNTYFEVVFSEILLN